MIRISHPEHDVSLETSDPLIILSDSITTRCWVGIK